MRDERERRTDNDDHQFDPIHLFTAIFVREVTEEELTDERTDWRCYLEAQILIRGENSAGRLLINHSDHDGADRDGEEICVREEREVSNDLRSSDGCRIDLP